MVNTSTESLAFLADFANKSALPKSIKLSAEAQEFCTRNDQFVFQAKQDVANDDVEARIGTTNFMIMAANAVAYMNEKRKDELSFDQSAISSKSAMELLDRRYHFESRLKHTRSALFFLRKLPPQWIYWVVVAVLTIALFAVGTVYFEKANRIFPPEESGTIWTGISDFVNYSVLGHERPLSAEAAWHQSLAVYPVVQRYLLAVLIVMVVLGLAAYCFRRYVERLTGQCARYHLFILYMQQLENEIKAMEDAGL